MQRTVIAVQLGKAAVDVSKQSVLRQGRQGAQHAAEGDIATSFKTRRGTVEKAKCRQSRARRAGCTLCPFPRRHLRWPAWICRWGLRALD